MKSKIARALEVASEAHSKQTRKFDGSLYANHLIEVLNLLLYGKEKDTSTLVAGVLHDVLEDTQWHSLNERVFGCCLPTF
jgi:GTP pyrophosphokinase